MPAVTSGGGAERRRGAAQVPVGVPDHHLHGDDEQAKDRGEDPLPPGEPGPRRWLDIGMPVKRMSRFTKGSWTVADSVDIAPSVFWSKVSEAPVLRLESSPTSLSTGLPLGGGTGAGRGVAAAVVAVGTVEPAGVLEEHAARTAASATAQMTAPAVRCMRFPPPGLWESAGSLPATLDRQKRATSK